MLMHDFHKRFIPTEVISPIKDNKKIVNAKWVKKEKNTEDFLFINQKWGLEIKV